MTGVEAIRDRAAMGERSLIACGGVAILAASFALSLMPTLIAWVAFLGLLTGLRLRGFSAAVFAMISLYGCSAWVNLFIGGVNYPPFPTFAVVENSTRDALQWTIIAFIASELVIGGRKIDGAVRQGASTVASGLRVGRLSMFPSLAVVGVLGLVDWLLLAQLGFGTVLGSARRSYSGELLTTSSHIVQIMFVAASIVVLLLHAQRGIRSRVQRFGGLGIIAVSWVPYLLVGSRKEVLIVIVTVSLVMLPSLRPRQYLAAAIGVVALFAYPALRADQWAFAFHEFILPQYIQFSIASNVVDASFAGSFWERSQFLLPAALRPGDPVDIGLAFYRTGATNVGVGAGLFGELQSLKNSGVTVGRPYMLAGLLLALFSILVLTKVRASWFCIVLAAHLLLLGRNDFWLSLFFAVYIGAMIHILIALSRTGKDRHAYDSHRLMHARTSARGGKAAREPEGSAGHNVDRDRAIGESPV